MADSSSKMTTGRRATKAGCPSVRDRDFVTIADITDEIMDAGISVIADYFNTIDPTARAALEEALKAMSRVCEHHSATFQLRPDAVVRRMTQAAAKPHKARRKGDTARALDPPIFDPSLAALSRSIKRLHGVRASVWVGELCRPLLLVMPYRNASKVPEETP